MGILGILTILAVIAAVTIPIVHECLDRWGDVGFGVFIGLTLGTITSLLFIPAAANYPTGDSYDGLYMPVKEIRAITTMSADTTEFAIAEYRLYTVQKGKLSDKNQVYLRYRVGNQIVDILKHKAKVVEMESIAVPCEERVYGVEYTGNMEIWSRLYWGDWDCWRHETYKEPEVTLFLPKGYKTIETNQ